MWRARCLAVAALAGCGVIPGTGSSSSSGGKADGSHGWSSDPVVEHDSATGEIWALSDPHGGIASLRELLYSAGLIDATAHWTGGAATFVVAGDLIDKGDYSLEVIDLLRE